MTTQEEQAKAKTDETLEEEENLIKTSSETETNQDNDSNEAVSEEDRYQALNDQFIRLQADFENYRKP